jgi:hypothetical protein
VRKGTRDDFSAHFVGAFARSGVRMHHGVALPRSVKLKEIAPVLFCAEANSTGTVSAISELNGLAD